MRQVHSPFWPGDRLGKYVVRCEIGRGGTAIVYEAEHEAISQYVAIKVLNPAVRDDHSYRVRFEHEVRALAQIHSRHVPQVHDAGELGDGLPYVVMERLRGESLTRWLFQHACLPIAFAVEIVIQTLSALEAVHRVGLVHRDVKPDNLILHEETDGRQVLKLLDLGLCKPIAQRTGPVRAVTLAGNVVGTPEYMSPEQAMGAAVDERTDIFSTGSLLYELLTDRPAFERDTTIATLQAVIQATPEPLASARPDCPPALAAVVERAMAKRPSARFSSASEMCDALLTFMESAGLRNHPSVIGLAPRTSASFSSIPAAPAAPEHAPDPEPPTGLDLGTLEPPKRASRRLSLAVGTVGLLALSGLGGALMAEGSGRTLMWLAGRNAEQPTSTDPSASATHSLALSSAAETSPGESLPAPPRIAPPLPLARRPLEPGWPSEVSLSMEESRSTDQSSVIEANGAFEASRTSEASRSSSDASRAEVSRTSEASRSNGANRSTEASARAAARPDRDGEARRRAPPADPAPAPAAESHGFEPLASLEAPRPETPSLDAEPPPRPDLPPVGTSFFGPGPSTPEGPSAGSPRPEEAAVEGDVEAIPQNPF